MSARTGPAATIAPPRRALRGIWPAARLAWRSAPAWLLTHIAATAATAVLPVATVWLLKAVLDDLTAGRSGQLRVSALGLFVAGATAAGLAPVSRYLRNQLSRAIKVQSQSQLYLATARLAGLSRLEQPAFRDRLRMAQQIGQAGPGEVVDGLLGVGQRILTVVGLLGVLTVINPLIAGLAVLGTVPALYMEVRLSRSRAAMMFAISPVERREIFYAELLTTLTAAKELRLLGLSELFRRRMLTELATADGHRRRLDAREMRTQLALGVAAAALTGAGLVWAIQAAASGRLGVGDVSAFVAAMAAVQAGLPSLVSQVAGVYHSLAMFDHYRSVLDEPSDLPVAAHPRPVPPLRRGIELRDVWFRYGPDQPWILRGVNLTIPAGQALALVGLNGAGKSTMVKLLCRFYDPQRGSLHWDGLDLREFDVAELRQRIGAVFQDYMAYDLTAAENIGLGDVAHLD
ncbi:MAG TPA: ABC transporter ATP-binding protein, partial [Micromonosporaceae bacterium]